MGFFPSPRGNLEIFVFHIDGEDRGENVGRKKWMEVFPLSLKTIVRDIFDTSEEKE